MALGCSKYWPLMVFVLALTAPAAARELPAGFVYLRDIDATIVQDMRYAGADNFTGHPLPGYGAAECVLRRAVAEALKRAQAELAKQNLGLKVYDCYRPQRAVRAFARWAHNGESDGATKRFYPGYDKRELFALGFIASHSVHSTGGAVDLTLVPLSGARSLPHSPLVPAKAGTQGQPATSESVILDSRLRGNERRWNAPCTAPAALRAPDTSLDMGTGFDCFDAMSATLSRAIASDQARRRTLLTAAMRAQGLHNYFREWWHFSLGARPVPAFDFPIEPR